MPGFDASQFAPSMGLLSRLSNFGAKSGMGGFAPDLSAAAATQKSFSNLPMIPGGGGRIADPSSVSANLQGSLNPVRAGAITQQAGEYDQNKQQLSDFLLQNGIDQQSIQAMLAALKAMQIRSSTAASSGVMGGLF